MTHCQRPLGHGDAEQEPAEAQHRRVDFVCVARVRHLAEDDEEREERKKPDPRQREQRKPSAEGRPSASRKRSPSRRRRRAWSRRQVSIVSQTKRSRNAAASTLTAATCWASKPERNDPFRPPAWRGRPSAARGRPARLPPSRRPGTRHETSIDSVGRTPTVAHLSHSVSGNAAKTTGSRRPSGGPTCAAASARRRR